MAYIVVFNTGSSDAIFLDDNHGFLEKFDDYWTACEIAESWIDGHDFRSYAVFEQVEIF